MSVSSEPIDRLDDPIRRPRRLAVVELVAVAAITVGALVAWSPVVGLAIAGLVVVGWFAWPRWLHTDIDYYAAGVLITAVLFGIPRQVDVGGASLGGALSALLVAVAVLLLIHRTGRIDRAWRAMWPLVGFLAWSWFSLRGAATLEGLQNVVVFTGFIVIATLAYVRTLEDPSFTERLEKLFERTFWLLAILGAASIAVYGPGRGFLVPEHGASRSLALLLLPMCASGLARWRYGDRRYGPVIFAISLALMAFSLSRATLVIGCVLFALSRFTPRSVAGIVRLVTGLLVAACLLWAAVTFIQPLHDRFFPTHGDLVAVGGVQISATGRSDLWGETWRNFLGSPWVGHGAGASEAFLTTLGGADHPHNDYLRLLNDYGVLGTALWALGIFVVSVPMYRDWLRRDDRGDPLARIQLWALLTIAGFLVAMVTANPLVYMHVQGPLGLIVGASLALVALGVSAQREPSPEAAALEPVARVRPLPVRPESAP